MGILFIGDLSSIIFNMKNLLFFYGLECPHCVSTEKEVDTLIKEGFPIDKLEVYHNNENDKLLIELDSADDCCGGVPFFINQKNGKTLCGEVSYKEIKNWATS